MQETNFPYSVKLKNITDKIVKVLYTSPIDDDVSLIEGVARKTETIYAQPNTTSYLSLYGNLDFIRLYIDNPDKTLLDAITIRPGNSCFIINDTGFSKCLSEELNLQEINYPNESIPIVKSKSKGILFWILLFIIIFLILLYLIKR